MKYLIIGALISLNIGCATKVVTEYKEVRIPIKCTATMPQKPEAVDPVSLWLADIISYAMELETALKQCIGGPYGK